MGMIDPRSDGPTAHNERNDDAPAINAALAQSARTGAAVFLPRGIGTSKVLQWYRVARH
jgi:hypothetical protein